MCDDAAFQSSVLDHILENHGGELFLEPELEIQPTLDFIGTTPFKLSTPFASVALKITTQVLASCENVVPGAFKQFSNNLVSSLRKCIPSAAQGIPSKVQRQHMWSNYHHLISSKPFQDSWALFLKEMGTQSSPTLYQFVTMQLMDVLIKQQFPLPVEPGTHCFVPELSTAEDIGVGSKFEVERPCCAARSAAKKMKNDFRRA